MMNIKNNIILIFILLLSISSCRSQNKIEPNTLKEEVAKFLLDKGEWNNEQYSKFTKTGKGFVVRGIYNQLDFEKLREGIYWVYRGTHTREYFLLYEDGITSILDISTQEELSKSISKVLKYFVKRELCVEIINEYLSKMIRVHYSINKNIPRRSSKDPNCRENHKITNSQIDLNQVRLRLVDYLVKKGKFKNTEQYLDDPKSLVIKSPNIYYGISDNGDLDIGIYLFYSFEDSDRQIYYLLVGEGNYEILSIDNNESLNESINDILNFVEDNKFCHKIAISYIEELINTYYSNSCLESFKKELP